jgi:2-keto-4-pentenoate hydratase/2-oxohepta-3-ene-1,7-dioic acid hydratase in catechol pathway
MSMMQWVRFRTHEGRIGFGALDNGSIVEYVGDVFANPKRQRTVLSPRRFTLLAPCTPSKIVALWNNFHELGAKLGKAAPSHPLFLLKPASSVAGPGESIRRPAGYPGRILFEGELGIVIGQYFRELSIEQSAQAIFGYTCVNDVTAGELLNENADFVQWCRAKGSDTFGCIGPAISTEFEWTKARVVTTVDGVERQNYPLSDMIFSPAELVSRLSWDMSLLPGDVIACGTSIGVGTIKDGSTVAVGIEGIGSLQNKLAAKPASPLAASASPVTTD